jgi:hypothetical protein
VQRKLAADSAAAPIAIQRDDDTPDPQTGTDIAPPRKDPLTSPGGPIDTGDKSIQCGWVNGRFQCGVDIGKGDPLTTPAWPKSGGAPPPASSKEATCPGNYARVFDQCCPSGTRVSDDGAVCQPVHPDRPVIPIPPPEPEQKGDFPVVTPGPDEQYA